VKVRERGGLESRVKESRGLERVEDLKEGAQ
jgi:hypothetical protein